MASRKVNINLSNNLGDIQIYVDPVKQRQAERLIAKTPSIMKLGYELGTRKFGNQLLRIVRRSLNKGLPPPGSKVSWPPHAIATLKKATAIPKKYGAHTLLNLTGQYARSVTMVTQKDRTFVGIPPGLRKITYSGKTSRKTLNQVAIMLEYGSIDGNLPPRPLWKPAFEVAGGNVVLEKEIRNQLRKELRKYTK
jgi:hypothetical protein